MPRSMRRRYIAVEIESDRTFDQRDFIDAVWESILTLFGEYGASQTELTLVEYDYQKKQAILRCSHRALDLVKASIVAIGQIKDEEAVIHVLRVSGTLKSLRRKMQSQQSMC